MLVRQATNRSQIGQGVLADYLWVHVGVGAVNDLQLMP